ncbi:hypothetical protein ASF58_24465 [Methylobacterium sp. Leaf125]|uniref:helix-turn-helix domain-containing protein n=1 Tax=Methylobacterium sp. Leaf125 TaxID=1736265 RepID=UPI0006F6AE31|nr:helix-turn-helix transcriptional regulator [Methylobacterium sp. Leaf125]KQQ30773.1 hypothetical protein ASF58_24465 [Methylobacterium sp. Leaf125]
MNYATEELLKELKAARDKAGLSQRDLSAKIGVPQSHISKIENGGTDLRLSSLVEIARALDLELKFVPRKLMPAVEAIVRNASPTPTSEARYRTTVLSRLQTALAKLAQVEPENSELRRLEQILRELANFQLGLPEFSTIQNATDRLRKAGQGREARQAIHHATEQLRGLRNRIAHALPEPPRPAYSLDREEDDA